MADNGSTTESSFEVDPRYIELQKLKPSATEFCITPMWYGIPKLGVLRRGCGKPAVVCGKSGGILWRNCGKRVE
jgi:hypothetical protein